jgi:hypothetical protein
LNAANTVDGGVMSSASPTGEQRRRGGVLAVVDHVDVRQGGEGLLSPVRVDPAELGQLAVRVTVGDVEGPAGMGEERHLRQCGSHVSGGQVRGGDGQRAALAGPGGHNGPARRGGMRADGVDRARRLVG